MAFAILIVFGVPVNFIYRKFLALAVTSIFFSFALATFLYIKSFYAKPEELAKGGNSGKQLLQIFISLLLFHVFKSVVHQLIVASEYDWLAYFGFYLMINLAS